MTELSHLQSLPDGTAAPSRMSTLVIITVTAIVTCFLTLCGIDGLWVLSHQPPLPPRLLPPKSITVYVHPCLQLGLEHGIPPTKIPPDKMDFVFRLVTPDYPFKGSVDDLLAPLIAEVVITHEGQNDTHLFIRDFGVNPPLVSVDGKSYFFGRADDDVFAGGNQLVKLVGTIRAAKAK